ncbi:MAG TPA: CHAD domain-containing protein, partial [Devosia sp.]|nr:CHAD domain-containing protein [Devosia sp.]
AEGRSVVHEVRRRCKKLRALLRLIRPGFSAFAAEDAAVREAARLLSHLRDAEAMRLTVQALAPRLPAGVAEEALGRLGSEPGRADASEQLGASRARLAALRERADGWSISESGWAALGPGLRRSYRSARRRMRAAQCAPEPAALHDWRKALKHHGFHLDLLRRSAPDAIGAQSALADRLGVLLGEHHDLSVLDRAAADQPARLGEAEAIALLREAAEARRREIEEEAFELGRQIFAERPRALKRRFAAYWRQAR